jgi:hypothetical protein
MSAWLFYKLRAASKRYKKTHKLSQIGSLKKSYVLANHLRVEGKTLICHKFLFPELSLSEF